VRDQATGAAAFELDLELEGDTVTAAELIRGRVLAELMEHAGEVPRPLVETTAEERALNGPRRDTTPDVDRETARALEAFRRGRFVLLADGRQLITEYDRIELTPATDVTFLRLVPLQGG
jgi:hypothetical protein